jgi:septum site-determining protein MinC
MSQSAPSLQGSLFTLLTVKVPHDFQESLPAYLDQHIGTNPQFFAGQGVVLDIDEATTLRSGSQVTHVVGILKHYKLYPIGTVGGTPEQQALFRGQNMPSLGAAQSNRKPVESASGQRAATRTKIVSTPVRGGTQVYAQGADLVVLSSVGAGAEVIADGNIHVYGTLRGRALAGAMGDGAARIFCRSLEAELVSVAGNYITADQIDGAYQQQMVQIHLEGERLIIDKI